MATKRTAAALAALSAAIGVLSPIVATSRAFTAQDLVMLDRVSDPQLSPDGQIRVYTVRETDWAVKRGRARLWRSTLGTPGAPHERLTARGSNSSSPR